MDGKIQSKYQPFLYELPNVWCAQLEVTASVSGAASDQTPRSCCSSARAVCSLLKNLLCFAFVLLQEGWQRVNQGNLALRICFHLKI